MTKKVRISGVIIEYLEEDETSVANAQEILDLLSDKMASHYGSGNASIVSRLKQGDIVEVSGG